MAVVKCFVFCVIGVVVAAVAAIFIVFSVTVNLKNRLQTCEI